MTKKINSKLEVKNYPDVYVKIKHHKKNIKKITGVLFNKTLDLQNKQTEIENILNTPISEIALINEITKKFKRYLQNIKPIFQVKSSSELLEYLYKSTVKGSEKHIYEFLVALLELIKINKASLQYFLLYNIASYIDARGRDDNKPKTQILKVTLLALLVEKSGQYFLSIIDAAKDIKLKYESCGNSPNKKLKYNKLCKLLDSPIIVEAKTLVESQEYHIQMLNFFEATLQKMEMFIEEKTFTSRDIYKYKCKNKHRIHYVYKLTNNLTSLFSNIPNNNVNFPRVVKPLDWIIQDSEESGSELACDGLLMNKNKYFKKSSAEIKVSFKKYHVENLNFIQEQKYVIDSKLLKHVVDNFDECLYQYLLMMDMGSSMNEEILELFMQKKLGGYRYFSQEEFEINFDAKLEINPDFSMGFSAIDIFNKLSHQIVKYYQIVDLARLFSTFGLEIYFPWTYDFRMRMHPIGNILSPHGGDLSRSLLNPYNEGQVLHSFSDSSDQVVRDLNNENIKKNYFSSLKNNLNGGVKTVSLDASASGIQLLGACLGNLTILKLTNFLTTKREDSKKRDFYQIITELVLNKLKTEGVKKLINKISKNFKKVLDRSFIKNWTIAFFGGQGISERTKSLIKRAKSLRHTFPVVIDDRELSTLCLKVANFLTQAIEVTFPEMIDYMVLIKESTKLALKNNDKITIGCGTLHSVIDFAYFEHTEYAKPAMKSGVRRRGAAVTVSSDMLDSGKIGSSILSNLAHNRDAEIMQYVISECRKSAIGVVPIHDCMVVDVAKADLVKTFYFKGIYDILINSDSVNFFIESNKLTLVNKETWSNARENIKNEIKKGSLKMNFYILNST